jgi:hypothetical protein
MAISRVVSTREHVISTLSQSGWDPRGDASTLWRRKRRSTARPDDSHTPVFTAHTLAIERISQTMDSDTARNVQPWRQGWSAKGRARLLERGEATDEFEIPIERSHEGHGTPKP